MYRAPIQDMMFALGTAGGADQVWGQPPFEEVTPELAESVLREAARFAEGVLLPLGRTAETAPPVIRDGQVQEAPGFAAAYRQFAQGGWSACAASPEVGGMGLPQSLSLAVSEIWSATNMSFSTCPLLTSGAVEAIDQHANDALKGRFLEDLVRGACTGTMNLTEPQAGTDLAAIRTRAVPEGDHYRIFGQKIYITWGDHQMTDNILHLVLARIQGAPAGVHGISLFLVPKYTVDEPGAATRRNDLRPVALEHKLGIHGSPTCVMSFGEEGRGALGYLIGEENRGLACMFTMMNNARLTVGIQAVGLCEHACQKAIAFARERVQGRPAGRTGGSIIEHPDVRRMLMLMKSLTQAARAICYLAADSVDRERIGQVQAARRTALLIPIAKGWSTEIAQEVTSLGVQVHGGMGYVEETGAAQMFRDARITSIYEGTTGIQANDFMVRKVLRDGGRELSRLLGEMRAVCDRAHTCDELCAAAHQLRASIEDIQETLAWLLDVRDEVLCAAASFNFLMGCGACLGTCLLLMEALEVRQPGAQETEFQCAKIAICNACVAEVLPRTAACLSAVRSVGTQDQESIRAALCG